MSKSEKTIFISDLSEGREISAPFFINSLGRGRTNRGGVYLNVELSDKSGRLAAKVWDGAETLAPRLAEGTVAMVRGYVDSYRGSLQLVIRDAEPLPKEAINWPDYLKTSPRPLAEMKVELWDMVNSMADNDFRRLTSAALAHREVGDKYYNFPAAKSLHHAYLHGLLEHSLSVAMMARKAGEHYPGLNPDLLLAGALMHDLGKIWEFSPPPGSDYSTLGRLKGHLVMGCEFLGRVATEMESFPTEKLTLLQHLILSHHGEPEFGAPVRPQLLEAIVLHHLDNIDAKLEAVGSFIENSAGDDGWSDYHRLFGGHYMRTLHLEPGAAEEAEPEKPIEPERNSETEDAAGSGDEAGDALNSDNDRLLF